MITGIYRDKHPRVVLTLSGIRGEIPIEFIVDTGFEGDLKVPPHLAVKLDLTYVSHKYHKLANGEEGEYPVYSGVIDWADGIRVVDVLVMDGESLIGTGLLEGMSLYVEGFEGGDVTIETL